MGDIGTIFGQFDVEYVGSVPIKRATADDIADAAGRVKVCVQEIGGERENQKKKKSEED
mgnify:CR=1 FL=1